MQKQASIISPFLETCIKHALHKCFTLTKLCFILLPKGMNTPLFETPNLKVPRLSSSAMTSPASPAKWTHSSPRGPIPTVYAVRITVDTLNCYHTCSITHLHFSSAITLMSAHTLERHPAQSCLSVFFSLPHIPILSPSAGRITALSSVMFLYWSVLVVC